jgi:DNA invertase Pin-like site-specific DNA recombinase
MIRRATPSEAVPGRADAKANGVKFGRKPILTPRQQKEARKRLEAGETQRSVARSYNVSQNTISRLTT